MARIVADLVACQSVESYVTLVHAVRSFLRPLPSVINLLTLNAPSMEAFVSELNWPRYRAHQVLRWLYRRRVRRIDQMTDLTRAQRGELDELACIERSEPYQVLRSVDGSRKLLARLGDGLLVESVLIPDDDRLTLCVSTQIGCTLDCDFCLTGTMGLKRNLKSYEIVDQVLTAQDMLNPNEGLTNMVLMGMGEPLANLETVSEAIHLVTNTRWGIGLAPRRITLSTAGLATKLKDVADLGVNLAISLNATTEAQRARLMPAANRLHSLTSLLAACRAYPLSSRQRLTFEYVLLAGENDDPQDAKRLVRLLHGIRCKINLIPFNEFSGSPYRRPDDATVLTFQAILQRTGFDTFIRKSKGRDVLGACGQLGDMPAARVIPLLPVGME